ALTCWCCAELASAAIVFLLSMMLPRPWSTLFPYTTLFRSNDYVTRTWSCTVNGTPCSALGDAYSGTYYSNDGGATWCTAWGPVRSEEHTSELQSRVDLVCRLLLETQTYCHSPRRSPTSLRR